ncbi:MAG: hypothetical protein LBQ83_00230 [Candidatus Margulisbacteria bacterium]|jgi:hypothetical protein|nr:hypothetical protein [Candidatus Margulisiibacteriota bacterium]
MQILRKVVAERGGLTFFRRLINNIKADLLLEKNATNAELKNYMEQAALLDRILTDEIYAGHFTTASQVSVIVFKTLEWIACSGKEADEELVYLAKQILEDIAIREKILNKKKPGLSSDELEEHKAAMLREIINRGEAARRISARRRP